MFAGIMASGIVVTGINCYRNYGYNIIVPGIIMVPGIILVPGIIMVPGIISMQELCRQIKPTGMPGTNLAVTAVVSLNK